MPLQYIIIWWIWVIIHLYVYIYIICLLKLEYELFSLFDGHNFIIVKNLFIIVKFDVVLELVIRNNNEIIMMYKNRICKYNNIDVNFNFIF